MSNILDIPQIPTTAIELLQNDLHIGFTGDLKKRLDKEIRKTVDTFAALSIFPDKQEAALKLQPMLQKYTLDGRRLPAKPTAKGLYINKGNKVFIK